MGKTCGFTSSQRSTVEWFKERKLINKYMKILDLKGFRQENRRLSTFSKNKYGIEGQLFYEEEGGTKALPNSEMFNKIDANPKTHFTNRTYKQKSQSTAPTRLEVDKQLEGKLKSFLSGYGISVEFVESLKERGYDAIAIADIANKMILVSKNEADFSTLPEEVAHVAIEILGENNPMVKRLLDIIEQSPIYQETYNEYKEDVEYQKDGKPDVTKIKKEAIGKAVSEQLTGKQKNESLSGTISRIWNKIKSIFKKISKKDFNTEIDAITGSIANKILTNTLGGTADGLVGGIFKQKTNKKKTEAVENAENSIKTLQIRLKNLERKTDKHAEALKTKATISKIQVALIQKKAIAGTGYYVDHVAKEAEKLISVINAFKNKSESVSLPSHILKDIQDFYTVHSTTLDEMVGFFMADKEFMDSKDGASILEAARELQTSIETIKGFYRRSRKETIKAVVGREAKGQNIKGKENYTGDALFDITDTDTSSFRRHLLSLKHSNDEILRIVYNMMQVAENKADRATLIKGKELTNLQMALEAKGFKDFGKFYEKHSTGERKGRKTGNLISEFNLADFNSAKNNTKRAIAKDLGVESFSDIHVESLSELDAMKYKGHWKQFYEEHYNTKKQQPAEHFRNPVYASMTAAEKAFHSKLEEMKNEALAMLPITHQNNRNLMPQLRKDVLDRLKSKEQSVLANIKEVASESAVIMADETDFGDQETFFNPITGDVAKYVPISYTNRLDNMDNLSDDISSMYVTFYNMAANFSTKTEIADDLSLIKEVVGERIYQKGTDVKTGKETNTYKILSTFLDTHLYGEKKESEKGLTIFGKEIKNKKGQPVYLSKILDGFNSYVRRNNLAFNPFTHVANGLMGTAYNHIEAISGKYFDSSNKLWSEGEIWANMPAIVAQMGKRNKTNKVALLFEYNNVTKSTLNHFKDMNAKSKTQRVLFDSGVYGTYEAVDYKIKGKVMLSVYDTYRFINGKFVTKSELQNNMQDEAKANALWKTSRDKSLYNAYEVKDGAMVVKKEYQDHVDTNLEDRVKNTINQINDQVDGKLSSLDRSSLHRNVWGRLILTHRGWLLTGMEARWKTKGFNYSTDRMEEGYHRTFLNKSLKGIIRNKGNFKAALLDYNNLEEHEKQNIKKAWADIAFIAATLIIAGMLNGIADDEDKKDDWGYQFAAYMGTRMELEAWAFTNPFEVIDILESPAAGINQVESVMNGFKMFIPKSEGMDAFKEIDRGAYKGYTKLEKLLIKRSYAKNFFEMGDPRSKNTFLKQKIL